jgi:hypothetical protein
VPRVLAATPQKPWIKAVRFALSTVAVAFMLWAGRSLLRDWDSASDVAIDWRLMFLSWLPAIASNTAFGFAWVALLRSMVDQKPPTKPMLALYAQSQLGRYLPGKVGMPLMRMAGASRFGVSPTVTGTSVMLELLSWIATACGISFACLALIGQNDLGSILGPTATVVAIGIAAATGVGTLLDRTHIPAALTLRLGITGQGPLLPARLLVLHVVAWGLWALHAWLVARAVGASATATIASLPFFILSPVAGFLALLAPAGAGVREAIISIGLTSAVGPKAALAAALMTRVASLVADGGNWLATRHFDRDG